MKVAHPDHGQPFSPEVTFIIVIDGSCPLYITGWSLSLSKNVIAVTDALQKYGIATHGKPFLYYSDNGSCETNLTLDADVTDILRWLEIDHPTGIHRQSPGAHGIIECLNPRTLPMHMAATLPLITVTSADWKTVRKTGKALKSALNAQAKGPCTCDPVPKQNTLRKLPSWEMLIDEIKAPGVECGTTPGRTVSYPNATIASITAPAEFHRWKLENDGTELEWLADIV